MQIIVWKRVDLWPHDDGVRFDAAVWHSTVTANQDAVGGACPYYTLEQQTQQHQKTQKSWLFDFGSFLSLMFICFRVSPSLGFVLLLLPRLLLLLLPIAVAIFGGVRVSAIRPIRKHQKSKWRQNTELVLDQRSRPSSPLLPPLLALSIMTPFSAAATFAVWVWRLWRAGPTPDTQTNAVSWSQIGSNL